MAKAVRSSGSKITVFLGFILVVVIIMGTIMYIIESPINSKFQSIPQGIYWAIVTITTVGYGDLVPLTVLGQIMSSILMILGYAVITVPTGIVGVEYIDQKKKEKNPCKECEESNDLDALFCKKCGTSISKKG